MIVHHGPLGNLIAGHVLDVSRQGFSRALRDYDKQLYITWNPKKLKGWGCWEIRRRPNEKTAIYRGTHEGTDFYELCYLEYQDIHHVLDCAFLNYDAIRKLKEMDTWGTPNWAASFEAKTAALKAEMAEKAKEELKYNIKQHRGAASGFYEAVRSGIHPAQVLLSSNWALK